MKIHLADVTTATIKSARKYEIRKSVCRNTERDKRMFDVDQSMRKGCVDYDEGPIVPELFMDKLGEGVQAEAGASACMSFKFCDSTLDGGGGAVI